MVVLSLGCLGSLGASVALSYGHTPPGWPQFASRIGSLDPRRVAFFLSATRVWEFLAGVILALAAVRWTPGRLLRGGAAVAGMALLVLTMATVQSTDVFPGALVMMPVIGTLGLLIGGSGSPAPFVTRVLSLKPLVWLGDCSYSRYSVALAGDRLRPRPLCHRAFRSAPRAAVSLVRRRSPFDSSRSRSAGVGSGHRRGRPPPLRSSAS